MLLVRESSDFNFRVQLRRPSSTSSAFTGRLMPETTRLHLDTVATYHSTTGRLFQQIGDFLVGDNLLQEIFCLVIESNVYVDFQTCLTGKQRKTTATGARQVKWKLLVVKYRYGRSLKTTWYGSSFSVIFFETCETHFA